jgi:hypothetical protein
VYSSTVVPPAGANARADEDIAIDVLRSKIKELTNKNARIRSGAMNQVLDNVKLQIAVTKLNYSARLAAEVEELKLHQEHVALDINELGPKQKLCYEKLMLILNWTAGSSPI